MAKNFQQDGAKYSKVYDQYNPASASYQNKNEEVLGKLEKNKEVFAQYVSLWREYPDLFVDMIAGDSGFKLFPFQRLFLRVAIRNKNTFFTFTRAYSKSFLSVLLMIIKCILYPNSKLFVVASEKNQSARIASEKITEIMGMFPLLEKEVKKLEQNKDYVRIIFHNGSFFDCLALSNGTRGGRRTSGILEEIAFVNDEDANKVNEVILPLMNVNRRTPVGVDENEPHKQLIAVTSAGKVKTRISSNRYRTQIELQVIPKALSHNIGEITI